ncbi:MAG TPA: DoxX-like family protein, partial [Hanamia sp.]|nr:DoxX-like family protein [Hanamia sp.]
KLLNFVPRHQIIVARILGEKYSLIETRVIGVLEILMFIWIISKIKPRLCVFVQVIIIATMNIIEFILVPDLLLFGRVNIILAAILILIILFNEFWIYDNGKNN